VSTKINITVDSGGLSARAKQQQEAARLAQLERERTRRVEAEGKAQREAKQAAEGRRPDGQPQFGAPPAKPRQQDEPAANRAVSDVILTPRQFPSGTQSIPRLTTPEGIAAANSPSALRYKERFGNFYSVNEINTSSASTFPSAVNQLNSNLLSTYKIENGKKCILINQALPIIGFQTRGTKKGIKTGSGNPFTLEAWVYVPAISAINGTWQYEFSLQLHITSSPSTSNRFFSVAGMKCGTNSFGSVFSTEQWLVSYSNNEVSEITAPYNRDDNVKPIKGAWNHIAYGITGNTVYWFINGQLRASQGPTSPDGSLDFNITFANYENMVLQTYGFISIQVPSTNYDQANTLAFRGVRFTPKFRYSPAGFTPVFY
jgi:hypothetical protein